ncbi:MAG: methyltransferase domain-containing protein [Oscillospiraceae bacterium]|nr:methyltransferase domain-containing protein [Oscillospiraceae bacterium]
MADYKNWMPMSAVKTLAGTTALLTAGTAAVSYIGRKEDKPLIKAGAAVLGACTLACTAATAWTIYAHANYSYNGKRRLSAEIIEGISEYVDIPSGGIALDVGCSSGALTIAAAKRNPGATVYGLGIAGQKYTCYSRDLCEQNAKSEGADNTVFMSGDITNLDFPDEHFDTVMSNYAYHKINMNRQLLVRETLRVLKKGGTFVIHDIMSPRRYGNIQQLVTELKDEGFEQVELRRTDMGMFMSRAEAKVLFLEGSALLYGVK